MSLCLQSPLLLSSVLAFFLSTQCPGLLPVLFSGPQLLRGLTEALGPWGLALEKCSPALLTTMAVTGSALACGNARAVGSSHWITGPLSHPSHSRKPFRLQMRDEPTSSNWFSRKGQTVITKNHIYCNRLLSTEEELKLQTPPSHFGIFQSQQVLNRGCHWDPVVKAGWRVKGKWNC